MTPTAKLRFIERIVRSPEYYEGVSKRVRILQQWWEDENRLFDLITGNIVGEWRDVPLEGV